MADSFTAALNLTKPEIGASFDSWGNKLNGDMDLLDAVFLATGMGASVGLHVGTGKILNVEGQAQIADSTDTTKRALLDSSLISTATNRMYSFPDASGTFALQQLVMPTGTIISGYYGNVAPPGFVLLAGKTIGDGASGATARANADTVNLYTLLWTIGFVPTGGRGASAAADYGAHKPMPLPDHRGRVMAARDNLGGAAAGVLPGFTAVGQVGGQSTETAGVSGSASVTVSVSGGISGTAHGYLGGTVSDGAGVSGQSNIETDVTLAVGGSFSGSGSGSGSISGATATVTNVQPTIAVDVVIAL